MNAELRRAHVWLPGSGGPPLLLLHGTGGDEHDLLGLREHLAPDAPVLAPRGSVSEHGMARFFRRLREGVFDEDDLRLRADELAAFLTAAEHKYSVAAGSWLAVGFSNGANMASALLLRHPESLAGAVLLAAMAPFQNDGPRDHALAGKQVLIVNGRRDPMATPEQTRKLADQLRRRDATVSLLTFDDGHTIAAGQLPLIKRFIDSQRHP
ncbi:phospholipase/carboxylesterase [Kribbella sp. VKM Ac-2571]|uniref:alpha/beta hydrolase n=1 Tax=Kribbella sp. VKM Ac-2571 TaxID=2512222 RepID=UPI00105C9E2D|nr:alpha/beta hydrolase [Kribbella sp. VKM Ac-2571]TDO44824.1 phospholipase/carboxylesterase [Kribbella sp. VKM Ac-2571]